MTSSGLPTGAVYGFTTMLLRALREFKPARVAACFDHGRATFRQEAYAAYKAHRPQTPDELREQFTLAREILSALRIRTCSWPGLEADDLIGIITAAAERKNIPCLILTGDRDTMQLVSSLVKVCLTRKGISELEIYDEKAVKEKFGVSPSGYAALRGLTGDQTDNIPGVPGIGPKTAATLLQQYGTIENIYANLSKLSPRLQRLLSEYQEQVLLSHKLATILRSLPPELSSSTDLPLDPDAFHWPGPNIKQLLEVLQKLEFRSLVPQVIKEYGMKEEEQLPLPATATQPHSTLNTTVVSYYQPPVQFLTKPAEWEQMQQMIETTGCCSLALSGNRNTGFSALAIATYDQVYLATDLRGEEPRQRLQAILFHPRIKVYHHDAKENLWLLRAWQMANHQPAFDTMLAAYLLQPGRPCHSISDLALTHLGLVLPPGGEETLAATAAAIWRLAEQLMSKLQMEQLTDLYYRVELPLITVLASMEMTGIAVDRNRLQELGEEFDTQIHNIANEIYRQAGTFFNLNSPRQLGEILFKKLGLKASKKTKTGYSTSAEVLEELAGDHPLAALILEYRALSKLKSTYIDGLAAAINRETGRLHTTFHQCVTATGRLSSSEPNLQNIPVRMDQGKRIRQAFTASSPDNLLLSADYSQIELRILAHMADDPLLKEAFWSGEDIHARTAAEVFNVPLSAVTPEMRRRAKAVNFGIVYGISEFGLARDLKITRNEAKAYIAQYFARYRKVQEFINDTIATARTNGYVTTLLGRKRYLPELFSPDRNTRAFGERAAINTPIQGSAADIIKVAMLKIFDTIRSQRWKSAMVLQVHDELIFDIPKSEIEIIAHTVRTQMETALTLSVPLTVEVKAGPTWYDVKPLT